jgi:hypothetical protein
MAAAMLSRRVFRIWIVCWSVLHESGASSLSQDTQAITDTRTLRVILDAYASNRESFAAGQGNYLFKYGTDPDAHVFWAFGEGMCRCDISYDPDARRKSRRQIGPNRFIQEFGSFRRLTDGQSTCEVDVPADESESISAHVSAGTDLFYALYMLPPLNLGFPKHSSGPVELGETIDAALNGRMGIAAIFEGQQDLDGHSTAVVSVDRYGKAWRRYWIDVERGGIPLQVDEYLDGKRVTRETNEDLRQVGQGWLPFRARMTSSSPRGRTKERTLVSFEVGTPSDDTFRIPLRAKASIFDDVKGVAFVIKEDTQFGFGRFARPIQSVGTPAQMNARDFDLTEQPRGRRNTWFWLWSLLGVVSFVTGVVLMVKRSKAARG